MDHLKCSFLFLFSAIFLMACTSNPKSSENTEVTEVSSGSGDDYLFVYDYKMQMPASDSLRPAGKVKLYLSEDAIRSEMEMQMFGGTGQPLVMLGHYDKQDETILLDPKNKTYTTMDIEMPGDLEQKMKEMSHDTLIVVGKEKVNGYACTHLKIVTTINISSQLGSSIGVNTEPSITEYWVSKEVPGNNLMSKLIASRPKMMQGVNAGVYAYGVPVKMITNDDSKMTMTLTKAEAQSIPDEMFEIPDDYTENKKS